MKTHLHPVDPPDQINRHEQHPLRLSDRCPATGQAGKLARPEMYEESKLKRLLRLIRRMNVFLALAAVLGVSRSAPAANWYVRSSDDSGLNTLRERLSLAAPGDSI